ncbi:MAG: CrcB family protein [Candidatus Nanopelagicales bacterium]
MTFVLAVAIGGAIGAPLRYLLDLFVTRRASRYPGAREYSWGLLVVNTLGSALAGVFFAATSGDLQTLLITGLCGALTTFSGFGWETTRLWESFRSAAWAAILTIPVACVAAAWLALQVTSAIIA